ncbi:MAG: MarR family transcriptional regulator [Rhodospirillaceae bacterium]|nr:MAG: MarR family transcriptional regulator [Rhodospirillaceae bacterium]
MARSSPGVRRVAAVLNFIGDHPGQSFTLTDLVRALKLSRATCHALLTGLVEVGYLYRGNDKNYVLGPALVAIGRAAIQHATPLQIIQPELRALADEFDAICAAYSRDRDHVVLRERATCGSHIGWSPPPGARLKIQAPFAAIHFAWSPQAEIDAWLEASTPPLTPEQKSDIFKGMAFARNRGFMAYIRPTYLTSPERSAEQLYSGMQTDLPDFIVAELNLDQNYVLASIVAPVFDARGEIAFVLSLTGFNRSASGAEIEHIGHRLLEACGRIMTFLGGRQPPLSP